MTQHASIDWDQVRERLRASELALRGALRPDEKAISEVLERRAKRLAQPRANVSGRAGDSALLVFRLGEARFALHLKEVLEVGPLPPCTPVPGAGAEVLGVFSHRGEVCSVVDLGAILGSATEKSDRQQPAGCFLHVSAGGKEIRLRVDAVDQTLQARASDLVAPEATQAGHIGRYVKAIHPDGITVLDADLLCVGGINGSVQTPSAAAITGGAERTK